MKSIFKIISVVSLILLISTRLTGNNVASGYIITDQDTANYTKRVRVDSFPLPIIAPSSGVHFYKDKLMFLSLTKYERKMTPNHISFGSVDTYYASIGDSVTGKHQVFSTFFPFSFPVEAVTFNHTFDTIYFTKLADNDKSKIFMAKYSTAGQPGITGGIVPMEFCKGKYNYSHPALSVDGKTMIFASDNESSIGGMDLFVTRKTSYGWTNPENMGELINTRKNEFFPFLDSDNNLFFSSDGLKGFGGFDIFTCKFNGNGWDKPVNLSKSINSKYDDIAFSMSPVDGKSAFFTRRSGKNEMQLFKIRVTQENTNLLAIFNGNPAPKQLLAVTKEEQSQPAVVAPVTKPATKTDAKSEKKSDKKSTTLNTEKKTTASNTEKKSTASNTEKKPSASNTVAKSAPQKSAPVTELPVNATDAKFVPIKPTLPIPENLKDIIIFRVQISSSEKSMKGKEIVINGKSYPVFEYYYLGAYRYCIGEFTTLQAAVELQSICRKSVYPQAFVAGFKNSTRASDLKSFR